MIVPARIRLALMAALVLSRPAARQCRYMDCRRRFPDFPWHDGRSRTWPTQWPVADDRHDDLSPQPRTRPVLPANSHSRRVLLDLEDASVVAPIL